MYRLLFLFFLLPQLSLGQQVVIIANPCEGACKVRLFHNDSLVYEEVIVGREVNYFQAKEETWYWIEIDRLEPYKDVNNKMPKGISSGTSFKTTSIPAFAETKAIPAPIIPAPKIPTFLISYLS